MTHRNAVILSRDTLTFKLGVQVGDFGDIGDRFNYSGIITSLSNQQSQQSVVIPMALKRPLCNYDGVIKELAITDTLPGITGLFEVDVDGGMMPITDINSDNYYELDINDDIQPLGV